MVLGMTSKAEKVDEKYPIPSFEEIKGLISESYELFKEFLHKMVDIRVKYGISSFWMDTTESIADLRQPLENCEDSDIGKFYRMYMDYIYLVLKAGKFNDLLPEEVRKAGKILGLDDNKTSEWVAIQKRKSKLHGGEG